MGGFYKNSRDNMKIKKLYTSKGNSWEIRPLSKAKTVYQYFPVEREIGKLQPTFFLKNKEEREGYSLAVERKVLFVLDLIDREIKIFTCPISVWSEIERYMNRDVEVHKSGRGMQTRYISNPIHGGEVELMQLSDKQQRILAMAESQIDLISDYIETQCSEEIELKEPEAIENRFDIIDMDD